MTGDHCEINFTNHKQTQNALPFQRTVFHVAHPHSPTFGIKCNCVYLFLFFFLLFSFLINPDLLILLTCAHFLIHLINRKLRLYTKHKHAHILYIHKCKERGNMFNQVPKRHTVLLGSGANRVYAIYCIYIVSSMICASLSNHLPPHLHATAITPYRIVDQNIM